MLSCWGTVYNDTHLYQTNKHKQHNSNIIGVCMDTWALDSQFCKVQNKLSILKIGDSSVYTALVISFNEKFGNHFAQAGLPMITTVILIIECAYLKRQKPQHKRNVDQF